MSYADRSTNDVDRRVGRLIRERRVMLGMSQTQLAEAIGVTCTQVQKYENVTNRVSAGRLAEIARALKVPVSYFFDEKPATILGDRAALEAARIFDGIKDRRKRQVALKMLRAFATAA